MSHTVIDTKDGIYVCGDNNQGQLGLGHKKCQNQLHFLMKKNSIIQIATNSNNTFILREKRSKQDDNNNNNTEIIVIGSNYEGILGVGNNFIKYTKIPLILPFNNNKVKQISCGAYHTLLLTINYQIYSFGHSDFGQLGLGNFDNRNKPKLLEFNKKIIYVCCGDYHSIILTTNYEVFVFGRNDFGALGLGPEVESRCTPQFLLMDLSISDIACGWDYTVILNELKSNEILVFGYNSYGQLGLGHTENVYVPKLLTLDDSIIRVSCGESHTMILSDEGKVIVFGRNHHGQLGFNNCIDQNTPQLLMIDTTIRQINCTYYNSTILKNNGQALIFGNNMYGQLGLNNTKPILTPQLLTKNATIIANTRDLLKWSPLLHKYFSTNSRQQIYIVLLRLKRIQKITGIFVPKFIRFEIIKAYIY